MALLVETAPDAKSHKATVELCIVNQQIPMVKILRSVDPFQPSFQLSAFSGYSDLQHCCLMSPWASLCLC